MADECAREAKPRPAVIPSMTSFISGASTVSGLSGLARSQSASTPRRPGSTTTFAPIFLYEAPLQDLGNFMISDNGNAELRTTAPGLTLVDDRVHALTPA